MMAMDPEESRRGDLTADNKNHIRDRLITFSIALFLIILAGGGAAFFFSMRQIVKTNMANELSQTLEIKRITLENYVMNETAIVKKMAGSPLIKDYFADPANAELKTQAVKEIAAYRLALTNKSVYWINDIDKIFYNNYNAPYLVNPNSPENNWYNQTLYKTEEYNFNIKYNSALDVTDLWINAPVFDDGKKPIGMVGCGLELSALVNALFSDLDDRIEFYYFNADGEIAGASGKAGNAASAVVFLSAAKSLAPGETKTLAAPHGIIAVGTVPPLGWYAVAYMPYSANDYKTPMTALFLAMLAVISLILITFNVVAAGILESQRN